MEAPRKPSPVVGANAGGQRAKQAQSQKDAAPPSPPSLFSWLELNVSSNTTLASVPGAALLVLKMKGNLLELEESCS